MDNKKYLIEYMEHNEIMDIFKKQDLNGHYYLSPSKLFQRKICPASAAMEMKYSKLSTTSEVAEEGTRIHSLIETAIKTGECPDDRHVRNAVNFTKTIVRPDMENIECEKAIDIYGVKGTADYTFKWGAGKRVIIDWKTGFIANDIESYYEQLRAYTAAMMLKNLESTGEWFAFSTERNEIICAGVIDFTEAEKILEEISGLKALCESGTAHFSMNNHCKYCAANSVCPMVKSIQEELGLPAVAFESYLDNVDDLYDKVKTVEGMLTKLKNQVQARIKSLGGTEKWRVIRTKDSVETDWEGFSVMVLQNHPEYAEKLNEFQSFKKGFEKILENKSKK